MCILPGPIGSSTRGGMGPSTMSVIASFTPCQVVAIYFPLCSGVLSLWFVADFLCEG